jgi:hypothetical protein
MGWIVSDQLKQSIVCTAQFMIGMMCNLFSHGHRQLQIKSTSGLPYKKQRTLVVLDISDKIAQSCGWWCDGGWCDGVWEWGKVGGFMKVRLEVSR